MFRFLRRVTFPVALIGLSAGLCFPTHARAADTGQRVFGQVSIEPAINDANGNSIFLLTPDNAPLPSKSNPAAVAPMYLVLYPTSSSVPANDLNCQPTNCNHLEVLPFPVAGYGTLSDTDPLCKTFNGGNPCSPVAGHDHLVGVPSTHGDFNVAWSVKLVLFTGKAFGDGTINTRITTLSQLTTLMNNNEIFIADTPITFNCSITSQRTYDRGTPVTINVP